uniref:Ubiquitin-conjugating enzyme E2 7 n=1 Tax=Rhizophora mucronata TaxID=61149 RepID=A0A2P2N1T5_RHIMU
MRVISSNGVLRLLGRPIRFMKGDFSMLS